MHKRFLPDISEVQFKFTGIFCSFLKCTVYFVPTLITCNCFCSQGEWGHSLPTLSEISNWLDKATEADETIFYEQGKWWDILNRFL